MDQYSQFVIPTPNIPPNYLKSPPSPSHPYLPNSVSVTVSHLVRIPSQIAPLPPVTDTCLNLVLGIPVILGRYTRDVFIWRMLAIRIGGIIILSNIIDVTYLVTRCGNMRAHVILEFQN